MRFHIENLAAAVVQEDPQGVRIPWWLAQVHERSEKIRLKEERQQSKNRTGYWIDELAEVFLLISEVFEEQNLM